MSERRSAPARPFGRLLRLSAPFAGPMALAVLLGFLTMGSGIALLTTSAYLIASAALRPSIADLQVAIVGVRFFGITRGVFRYLERLAAHDVTFRLLARLRVWFYGRLEPLAPARLLEYRSGDLLARIVGDVEVLENFFLRVLAPPLVALLTTGLTALLMGRLDPRLALIQVGFLAAAGAGLPLLTRALGREPGRQLIRIRAALNAALLDGVQGVADLLAFGSEGRHLERIQALSRDLGAVQQRMTRISALHGALSGLLMNLATAALLVAAIPAVNAGALSGVALAVLVLAVISSFEAVLPLPQAFQTLETSLEAARRLFEIGDARPAVPAPAHPEPLPPEGSLRVEGLRFAYEPDGPPALDGVDLDLPVGRRVAVVGPSGAGKSTLVRLLLCFWDAQEGRILLGGRDVRQLDPEEVRRSMAVVAQDTHLFNATIRENLLLARPGATEEEMVGAARQAQLEPFISSLPDGYDTWAGEQGLRLSGGERQRVAIARAILQDAPVLILDEPTANLDAVTEQEVMDALYGLMEGRTALIITHRLVGLERVDEILVLRAGRVVERGSHLDLMQMGGLYRRMWDLQHQARVLDEGAGAGATTQHGA